MFRPIKFRKWESEVKKRNQRYFLDSGTAPGQKLQTFCLPRTLNYKQRLSLIPGYSLPLPSVGCSIVVQLNPEVKT